MSAANITRWLTPRDWESECEECAGAGKVDRSEPLHVDGRYMGQDLFREACDACDGRGFIVNVEDVPGFKRAARTLPAADTITLGSLETTADEALTFDAMEQLP